MAVTITDHRVIRNEADSTTGWTGTVTVFTSDPSPVESTGQLGATVGAIIFDAYHTGTGADLSDAVVYCWVFARVAMGNTTDANGGLMILLGDGTNRGAWKVAGADKAPFRHDDGPTGWICPALDTTSLPASPLSRAGSAASVNFSSITDVGTTVNSLVSAPGMNPTYHMDIMRYLLPSTNNGCALSIIGGTSGDPGTFTEIAATDRLTGNQQAHGILRQLAAGAFGCQGPLCFGNATGTSSSWFEDSNTVVVFEDRGFRTTLYKIFITDNGTGTTTFILNNCSLVTPSGVGASWDSLTDTDVTDVTLTGVRIEGFTQGIGVGGGAGQVFTNCIFSNGGAISVTSQPVDLTDSSVTTSTVAADASALVWNVATDPDGYLDGMTFSKGTNDHHAIEFGVSSPTTMTLRGVTFTGFNAVNGSNDSTLHIRRTSGTVTINVIGGTTPSYKSDGAAVDIVANPVSAAVNCKTTGGANIQNVRVLLQADTGGPFPSGVGITITNSGTTATVTHTTHGLATNDKVLINGASHWQNNGMFSITVSDANTYTYTLPGAPGSNPTGTITSTFVVLEGLTDVNGNITMSRVFPSDQPVSGRARKSSTPPFYKTSALTGTVSSGSGFSATAIMISDE